MRSLIVALALALLGGTSLAAAAQTSPPSPRVTGLVNCLGKPETRPSEIVFACADAGMMAQALHWTGWGEPFAAATGEMTINDCNPYCAAGKFHSYPVILTASRPQRCPNGALAYTEVTWAFVGRSPFGAADEGTKNPHQTFRCR
jgi:hypothetical protein